jgi:hypothetical protein
MQTLESGRHSLEPWFSKSVVDWQLQDHLRAFRKVTLKTRQVRSSSVLSHPGHHGRRLLEHFLLPPQSKLQAGSLTVPPVQKEDERPRKWP